MSSLLALPFLAALLMCASAAAAADTFPIQLTRRARVGDAADIHIVLDNTSHVSMIIAADAPREKIDDLKADLVARRDVLQVDPRGEPGQFTLTITSFTDGEGKPLAQPGDVLTVHRGETAVDVTSSGAAPSDGARQALSAIYQTLKAADSPTDDELFGIKAPQPVGGSWPVSPEATAKAAGESKLVVKAADIAGTATLDSTSATPAGPVLHISGKIVARNVTSTNLPPNAAIQASTLTTTFAGDYPSDAALPPAKATFTSTMHFAYSFDNVVATIDVRSEKTESCIPIKR